MIALAGIYVHGICVCATAYISTVCAWYISYSILHRSEGAMTDSSEASSLTVPPQKLFSRDDFAYDENSDDDYLGFGGFAEVYKATMRSTGLVVAAKVLFRRRGVDLRGRLQKEYVSSNRN